MILLVSLFLAQPGNITTDVRWDSTDVLIEDSLGEYVDFAADYNYTTGDIYVACITDAGTYCGPDNWGLLLFRSADHGESWDLLRCDSSNVSLNQGKEIDIVVTRNDTVYIAFSWHDFFIGNDKLSVKRLYDNGEEWVSEYVSVSYIYGTEISKPKLVRDDFDDFYLYITYINKTSGADNLFFLYSTDRGYNWDTLGYNNAEEFKDVDICTADSMLYAVNTARIGINYFLEFVYCAGRGDYIDGTMLQEYDTTSYNEMVYPRIGATTTLPYTGQLVYVFYSQENSFSGGYDLLYLYSQDGGDSWSSTSNTLAEGSLEPVICDLRGYQVASNPYMEIAYCFISDYPYDPYYSNFFSWSSETEPTSWHDTTFVSEGIGSSTPELIYSPGASGFVGGIVYNDFYGNLYFDAHWRSGIPESEDTEVKIKSRVVLSSGTVKINSSYAVIYDVMGRKLKKLNSNVWDLTDEKGREVDDGIYFIIDGKTGTKEKLILIK